MKITTIRWSAISSFEYDKEAWYQAYVLNIPQKSPQMDFGSYVDKRIQEDTSFIPAHPRYPVAQHPMKVMYDGLLMTGTADWVDFTPGNYRLADTKTGVAAWNKKRLDGQDSHKYAQLVMYAMMIYIDKKIRPEEFRYFLHWIPTRKSESGDFKVNIDFRDDPVVPITFETKITMTDILKFGNRIKSTVKAMESYKKSRQS